MAPKLSKTKKARKAQKDKAAKAAIKRAARDELIMVWRRDGYTLEEIAEEVGLSHQRVSKIIHAATGLRTPSKTRDSMEGTA